MNHIKIISISSTAKVGLVDVIVAPCNDYLSASGSNKSIDQVISNHRYLLREENKIRSEHTEIKSGDTFIVHQEYGEKPDLMYAVLALASQENPKEQLRNFYQNIFRKALENNLKSVRLPSLAEGIYSYKMEDVVNIGLTCASKYEQLRIEFDCYNDAYFQMFTAKLAALEK